jgi:rhamnogalacturonyl hydrolase YesR
MLEHRPADHPTRGFDEKLFCEIPTAILAAQQPDGLGRPSLLDPTQVPLGETSGSGFFVFGLAWDVNHGPLDRAKHWPAITRGWAGLVTGTKPDGFVGYVQTIGAAAPLKSESVQDSGSIPSPSSARARPTSVSHSTLAPRWLVSAQPASPFNRT